MDIPAGISPEATAAALRQNGFAVWLAADQEAAQALFWQEIFVPARHHTVSWGDSLTLHDLSLLPRLRTTAGVELTETFGSHLTWREQINNRREALRGDLFLTGTNAITAAGQLVNLDMIGNRVAGIAFGPREVVIFAGINKIVPDLAAAMDRVRTVAAPQNARRHPELSTPCQTTGRCGDCRSPQRICNAWLITEKSYPPGRIKLVLINAALGY